jgi:glycosyltransferase involved in cell wall biosynthesis
MVIGLSRQLLDQGWNVRTLFPDGDGADRVIDWSRYFQVSAQKAPDFMHMDRGRSLRDILTLATLLKENDFPAVNFHYGTSHASWRDTFAARLARKRRVVMSIHGSRGLDPATQAKQVKATRLASRFSDRVVVVTNWSRDNLVDCGLPAKKIDVVPCGLPIPRDIPDKRDARARFGLDCGALVVTTAARMVVEKGVGDFIEAAGRLAAPNDRMQVVVAGVGNQRDEFEMLARERLGPRARFLGHVDDVSSLYAASDVFVLATHAENCGLVYREAALHGIPVVGTAVGGNRETILDGQTGLIVPPQDIDALAKAIGRLLGDPALRERLGKDARERALVEFTEQAMARRYEAVFSGAA